MVLDRQELPDPVQAPLVPSGTRDDWVLEDWIADAERAVRGQTDAEAVDTLLFHLEGVAKEEVKLRPASQWSSPPGVFRILREAFSEQLTATQARRKFFARQQADRESAQDFAPALMVLLSRVERLSGAPEASKDVLLRGQFVENLKDLTLRHDIKRWARDHPAATFQDVRVEVHRYMEEDLPPGGQPQPGPLKWKRRRSAPRLLGRRSSKRSWLTSFLDRRSSPKNCRSSRRY